MSKSKSPHDDRIFINQSLFFRKERQRLLEGLLLEPLKEIRNQRIVETRRANLLEMITDTNPDKDAKRLQFYQRQVEFAKDDMAGNCEPLANYGLQHVMESKEAITDKRLEVMNFSQPFDHCILVLGKDPNIQDGDYTKWNKDVMFIDPWLNKVMNLQEFDQFWRKNFPQIEGDSRPDSKTDIECSMKKRLGH